MPTAVVNLTIPDKGQLIGRVVKRQGGKRVLVECTDGVTRSASIPGRMTYKKERLMDNAYVLCTVGELGTEQSCIVELKYSPEHVRQLEKQGLINNITKEEINQVLNVQQEGGAAEPNGPKPKKPTVSYNDFLDKILDDVENAEGEGEEDKEDKDDEDEYEYEYEYSDNE